MAPGRSIGTVYAELDLDRSRYTKAQQQLYKDATTTTLNIEDNFRKLGIKSAAHYDLMRAKIENAHAAIARSAKATADDILRAEKAKVDALQRINNEQFGHQTSLISSLKSHWLAASAIIAGAGIAATKAWALIKEGADYEEQKGILDSLSRKYDLTADSIVGSMREASDGLIANTDLMGIALGGLAKGLDPTQMQNLAGAAAILGDAVGKDATTALRELTEALETGRAKGLKGYMGAALDLKAVFGDLEGKLTDVEKAQAMYSLTMIHATELQAQQTKAVDSTADNIERLEAKYKNLMTSAALTAKSIAVGLLTSEGWVEGALAMSGLEMPSVPAGAVAPGVNPDEAEHGRSNRLSIYRDALERQKTVVKAREDAEKAAKDAATLLKKQKEEERKDLIASLEAEEKEYEDSLRTQATMTDKALDERKRMEAEDWRARMAGIEAETRKYEESLIATAEAIDAKKKANADLLTATRNLYQDMTGYGKEYLTASETLIDKQSEEYRKQGVDETAVKVWALQEKQRAFERYANAEGSVLDRLKARHQKFAREEASIHKAAYEMIDAGAADLEGQISDNFFDVLTGNMQRVSLDWESMWQAMARSASNYAAKIATDMAVSYGSKAVTSGAGWLWDLAGGASGIAEGISSGWDSLVDFFTGFAEGSIEISEDKLAKLHKGEMVIPADQAESLRAMFSGQSPSDAGFPDFAGFNLSPEMNYAINRGVEDFMGGYGKAMLGKELAALALTGTLANPVLGLMATARELMGAAFTGYSAYQEMASFRDIAELATNYGGNIMGGYGGIPSGIGMDMGGYEGGYGGGSHGDPTGDMGGPGGEPGWRTGGISIGPDTGYKATLHGTEAVVPLPNGKSIPVEMKDGGGDLPPVQLVVQLDSREVAEALFKLSRSGVKIIHTNGVTSVG